MPPTRWKYWVRGCLQAFEGILQVAWLHFADYVPPSRHFCALLVRFWAPLKALRLLWVPLGCEFGMSVVINERQIPNQ